jgi:hypothetical protein
MNLARAATLIALLLSASTVAIWLLVDPPIGCPSWGISWFLLIGWTGLLLAINCFVVVRWNWCVRQSAERDASSFLVPVEYGLTRICVFNAFASQLPL